jgi:serine/threonine-protein phosphatase 2A activator
VATYLCESFGNPTRIDYGTGHEAAFLFFLCAAGACGALAAGDLPCVGLRVFPAYVRLCRALQRAYGARAPPTRRRLLRASHDAPGRNIAC